MRKIALVPLDERPCNYLFAPALARMADVEVVRPPLNIMGQKKQRGDVPQIHQWLMDIASEVDGFILSFDTLLYSGIVPSRLHNESVDSLQPYLKTVKKIKASFPDKPLFGFSLIMRNPTYSNSDEEPDYYQDFGREIHRKGFIEHKQKLKIASEAERNELISIQERLPLEYYEDYCQRRDVNLKMNQEIIKLVADNIIDFLIIPQDDASPYGLTAVDQDVVRKTIIRFEVGMRVLMYPGADEVANTLLSRMILQEQSMPLNVLVRYTSEGASQLIPLYEDRPLHETLKYQIIAAGGRMVTSMAEADVLLVVNAPPSNMLNASMAHLRSIEYNAFRNLPEAVLQMKHVLEQTVKSVVLADVAYGNGSDLEMINLLKQEDLLFKLHGYAGWNTSSNTLGTAIPMGFLRHRFGPSKHHLDFLGWRYAEDGGYCAIVRQEVTAKLQDMKLNYFEVDGSEGVVSNMVRDRIQNFLDQHINDLNHQVKINRCWMPWNRMFEVGLEVRVEHQNNPL